MFISVQLSLNSCKHSTFTFLFFMYLGSYYEWCVFTATAVVSMLTKSNSRVIMVQPANSLAMPAVPVKQNGFGSNHKMVSPYEYQLHQLEHNPRISKEVLLGKRVRFYHIKGTLGTGNFSKVRLGVHLLTKGT